MKTNIRITIKHARDVKTTVLGVVDLERNATNDEVIETAVEDGLIEEMDVDFVKKIERLTDEEMQDAEELEEDEDDEEDEEEEFGEED